MKDMLKNFPAEVVKMYDKDGKIIKEVKGLFGKTGFTIADVSIPILEGQIVYRTLPNGTIEK